MKDKVSHLIVSRNCISSGPARLWPPSSVYSCIGLATISAQMTSAPIDKIQTLKFAGGGDRKCASVKNARVENAEVDQSVPDCRAGKCETSKYRQPTVF